MGRGDLSDAEWELIGPLLPPERGRWAQPAGDSRRFLNGMLHVLLMEIPVAAPKALLAAKWYDGDRFRESLLIRGILPIIPPRSNRTVPEHPDYRRYRDRNRVERMFGKLKQHRRIATRYDKTRCSKQPAFRFEPTSAKKQPDPARHCKLHESAKCGSKKLARPEPGKPHPCAATPFRAFAAARQSLLQTLRAFCAASPRSRLDKIAERVARQSG